MRFDIWVMFGVSILLGIFVLAKGTIGRFSGVGFLVGYFAYLWAIY